MNEFAPNDPLAFDLTGRTLGDYRIIRRLGRGGMADVYLAEQISLGRNVALKVLKPDLAKDRSYIDRFRREAQSAARLVQSNIVQIYEVGEADGYHFIAQEYVPGRNLRQYLARHGAVESVMAVNVLRQVAMALQKAAEMNVIHRDIKPENIMLSTSGEIKVADFGLARINDNPGQQNLTQIGITMGTPLYMSPEQVEGKPVDPRSDIYSLGVTIYHILSGEPPFDGENALSIALKHVKEEPPSLLDIRPDIPPELARLVHRMMAKSPEDRPQSAAQLLKEIRQIPVDRDTDWELLAERLASQDSGVAGVPTVAQASLDVTRRLQSIMQGNVRRWWARPSTWLLLILLGLIGGGAGYWWATQHPVEDPLESALAGLPKVPLKKSIKDQYRYAHARPSVENYQAVLDYFKLEDAPPDEKNITLLYRNRTLERMAELYLSKQDWAAAEEIYRQFVQLPETERLNTVGHAGLAIICHQQNRTSEMLEHLNEIDDEEVELLNEIFRDVIVELKRQHGFSQVFVRYPESPIRYWSSSIG